jgi:pyridoxamine 5'-phosphate oxidase
MLENIIARFALGGTLPNPLPSDPFPMVDAWVNEAKSGKIQPNPTAMSLATIDPDGTPSVRVVLCRGLSVERGTATFYTNYRGRKGRAIANNPRVCVNFHWDTLDRQIRIEGLATRTSAATSDAYFKTRPWEHRLGAWASEQSAPLASRGELLEQAAERISDLGLNLIELAARGNDVEIPRPEHWGGFEIWATRVELWLGGPGRFHDRALWSRDLKADGDGYRGGPWSATRLQP